MTEVKSIRFSDEILAAVREQSRREQLDESTTIRRLIVAGLREYAVDLYRNGEISLREAAKIANLPLRDMLDLMEQRGVRGNVTMEQQRRALQHAMDALRRES